MCRRLVAPQASLGLLRLRTSPQFKVVRCYGQLYADSDQEGLYHVANVDPGQTFVFDFDHTTTAGFDQEGALPPTLQVAFQYTVLQQHSEAVPDQGNGSSSSWDSQQHGSSSNVGSSNARLSFSLQRRLRVLTLR